LAVFENRRIIFRVPTRLQTLYQSGALATKGGVDPRYTGGLMEQDVDWLINTRARAPLGGCQDVRIREPYAFAADHGNLRWLFQDTPRFALPWGEGERRRLLVWQRPLGITRNLAAVRGALERGYLVIVDYDDYPYRAEDIACDYFPLRACHAIQTSTPALAEILRRHNPNVVVFENKISPPPARPCTGREHRDPRILFAALNRTEEMLALAPALGAVLNSHPLAELVVVGDRVVHDAIYSPNKSFHPLLDYADYWACMDNVDIVLLPLSDTLFNRCKSPLKFLEASARGVAALASPTVYNGLIRHDHNGLLFVDGEQFTRALEILITRPDQRRRLAETARVEVMEDWRFTAADFERRLAWYDVLDHDREALNRALMIRAPELA